VCPSAGLDVKRRRHAVQLIEEDVTTPHPIAKGGGSYKSKPLSADDIKKAKSAGGAAAVTPLSPPRRDSDPGKRARDDEEEAFPDSADVRYDEGESRPSKKKKKRVSWASDEKLVQVKMFEKYLPSLVRQPLPCSVARVMHSSPDQMDLIRPIRWAMRSDQRAPLRP
jgi:hypothetical protein